MKNSGESFFWKHFTLREVLYLGFCATFIVLTKSIFRFHLHITGHSMFFIMFFLLLARGSVHKNGTATLVALVAGVLGTLFGMGQEGPLKVFKFLLPGLAVDIGGFFYPRIATSFIACTLVAVIASVSRVLLFAIIELLIGMDVGLIVQHILLSSVMTTVFGVAGALMVPPVTRRLAANGLISNIS